MLAILDKSTECIQSAQPWNYSQPNQVSATGKRGNQYGSDHLGKVATFTDLIFAKKSESRNTHWQG